MNKITTQVNNKGKLIPSDGDIVCLNKPKHITINRTERYSSGLRWKLGLNTNPCIQLRRGSRCVYCGFLNYTDPIPPYQVGNAFEEVLKHSDLSGLRRLELYVSGSFFDDDEVSPSARLEIVKSISHTDISEVLLESRPEFITATNLQSLAGIISPNRLTIAVGVETMNDDLRNSLSKGFSTQDVVRSLHTIGQAGMSFQAYLLLNPPSVNNDREALLDVINSSKEIIQITKAVNCNLTLAIQPFFLASNSIVADDPIQKDSIKPPWLYTIALTLKLLNVITENNRARPHILLGNENDNVDDIHAPSNYSTDGGVCSCSEEIRYHLREVNVSRDKLEETVQKVLDFPCNCRHVWAKEIDINIEELESELIEMEAQL